MKKKCHLIDRLIKESARRQAKIIAQKAQAAVKKTEYYTKGDELIAPTQKALWCKWVDESVSCFYYGQDFEVAIRIMEKLKNGGDVKDVKKILFGTHLPDFVVCGVLEILATFGEHGPRVYQQLKYEMLDKSVKNHSEISTKDVPEQNLL